MNILQIIGVILRHVKGYQFLESILTDSEKRAKRIETNLRMFEQLQSLDGLQTQILQNSIEDFNDIRAELDTVEHKLSDLSRARTFMSSPELVQKLSEINVRLAAKDDVLNILGMIAAFNLEQRNTHNLVVSLLTELNAKPPDMSTVQRKFAQLCQIRAIEEDIQNMTEERKGRGISQRMGYMHLATGTCLYEGKYGRKNFEEASQHLHAAVDAGRSEAYYFLGMLYLHGNGVARCNLTAKKFFQLGSDAQDPAAMTQLGRCYLFSVGVEKDSEVGMEYIKNAARGRDPYGMSNYSWYKLHGLNTDANYSLAFRYSFKASKKGYGLSVLGQCYEHGITVDRNPKKAFECYTEAVSRGTSFTARYRLAKCYELGIGVQIDQTRAAELYRRGSQLFTWESPYFNAYYGMCLIKGQGVEQNLKKGWEQVQKSIRGNNSIGWLVAGECYRYGYGVEVDLAKAVSHYQRAVTSESGLEGKVRARFALGCMYECGQGGLVQSDAKAFEHFEFAANRMHKEAQWKVGIACETGAGADRFLDRAVHYYRLAASNGHEQAQLKASDYYVQGKGISRDLHTNIQILEAGAEKGDTRAKRLLRRTKLGLLLRRLRPFKTRSVPLAHVENWKSN